MSVFENDEWEVLSIISSTAETFPGVIIAFTVVCRRVFTWVVLLLISVLLRVY